MTREAAWGGQALSSERDKSLVGFLRVFAQSDESVGDIRVAESGVRVRVRVRARARVRAWAAS
eukprot:391727-Rhodomonas_salina.3